MTYVLQACSTGRDVWVSSDFPTRLPLIGADGRNIYDVVADGQAGDLGFVPRFKRCNRGTRWGDLLWTTGDIKIASQRFIDVLTDVAATGWRTFEVSVLVNRTPVEGYLGLAVLSSSPADDLRNEDGVQWHASSVSDRVVEALETAEVTGLVIDKV